MTFAQDVDSKRKLRHITNIALLRPEGKPTPRGYHHHSKGDTMTTIIEAAKALSEADALLDTLAAQLGLAQSEREQALKNLIDLASAERLPVTVIDATDDVIEMPVAEQAHNGFSVDWSTEHFDPVS